MGQAPRDHYEVLGISRNASADEIKAAFRRLAAEHHPDRNQGDPNAAARFKEVNASYQVLSDPQRRAVYDRFGHQAEAPGSPFASGGPFAGGVVDISDIAVDGILGDLLGVFGVGRAGKGDLTAELEVTFEEAAFGCTKPLTYNKDASCTDCNATGAAPGSRAESCGDCQGRGRIRFQQGLFPIAVERTCTRCKGSGKVIANPCVRCRGRGQMPRPTTISVNVPPASDSGTQLLVQGAGNRVRPDRPPGDLEVTIRVLEHPFFRRSGDDVLCRLVVPFPVAALGGEVDVPTLDGKGKLKIPRGTQPGTVLRLRGKGIASKSGFGRGDQRTEISVHVPTALTERQREAIEALARELGDDMQPHPRSFADKLRGLFS